MVAILKEDKALLGKRRRLITSLTNAPRRTEFFMHAYLQCECGHPSVFLYNALLRREREESFCRDLMALFGV